MINKECIEFLNEKFNIEINNKIRRSELFNEMDDRIQYFQQIIEISKFMPEEEINKLLMKICTYFNVQIICYITGLRITKIEKNNEKEIPIFNINHFTFVDSIKSTKEVGALSAIVYEVQMLADELNIPIYTNDEIFEKKEWFNLQTIRRIIEDKLLLFSPSIISPISISNLKDIRDCAWKEFLTAGGIGFLAMLSIACTIKK